MNLEVADGDKTTEFHMGSKDGTTLFGKGHTDGADLTLSTDIDTARDVFVDNNPAAGMQAFMAGKVRIQGDMTKLMMAQAGGQGGNTAAHRSAAGDHRVGARFLERRRRYPGPSAVATLGDFDRDRSIGAGHARGRDFTGATPLTDG